MSASRAIPIVKPGTPTASTSGSPARRNADLPALATTTAPTIIPTAKLCKNISIYGHCKYQGKGCAYNHDVDSAARKALPASGQTTPVSSRPTTPSIASAAAPLTPLATLAASANVFVPKAASGGSTSLGVASGASTPTSSHAQTTFTSSTPSLLSATAKPVPPPADNAGPSATSDDADQQALQHYPEEQDEYGQEDFFDELNPYASSSSQAGSSAPQSGYYEHAQDDQNQQESHHQLSGSHEYEYDYGYGVHGLPGQEGNPYYPGSGLETSPAYGIAHLHGHPHHQRPLQYHLYQPSLPHVSNVSNIPHHQLIAQQFFMSPSLREDLQRRHEALSQMPTHRILPADGTGELGAYWGLIPLDKKLPSESGQRGHAGVFGYRTWTYRCTSENDGRAYVLKRIEGFRLGNEAAIALVEKWNRIRHPGIVTVREALTTRAFNDHSLIFAFDYHPLSSTLLEVHLSPPARGAPMPPLIPERVLWSYLVQLASALKAVHAAGMAVRCLDPSKVLLTGQNRLRIMGIAVLDVIAYDGGKNTSAFQQEDLLSIGKLLISLATHSLNAIHNLQASLEVVSRAYSQDFHNALLYLFSKPNHLRKSIDEFVRLISERMLEELNGALTQSDLLEAELSRELENARLFRLMAKFGFINERPEYDHDPRWAETGDRYLIKLFRDYLFHQVDENGRPLIDLSHVLTCLNKLDAGVDEQIALVSRDEQSCLVVSYREVKNCLDASFRELAR